MPDFTKLELKSEEKQLFESFVHEVNDSFGAYKKGSSINRTLEQTNYKLKDN